MGQSPSRGGSEAPRLMIEVAIRQQLPHLKTLTCQSQPFTVQCSSICHEQRQTSSILLQHVSTSRPRLLKLNTHPGMTNETVSTNGKSLTWKCTVSVVNSKDNLSQYPTALANNCEKQCGCLQWWTSRQEDSKTSVDSRNSGRIKPGNQACTGMTLRLTSPF